MQVPGLTEPQAAGIEVTEYEPKRAAQPYRSEASAEALAALWDDAYAEGFDDGARHSAWAPLCVGLVSGAIAGSLLTLIFTHL